MLPLLQLPEHGSVLEPQLYVEGHTDQDDAEQERYAPAPRRKRALSHYGHEYKEDGVAEDEPYGHPNLGEAPVEAPFVLRGVFRCQQDRTAPLAADGEALTEAQHEEDYGGCDPDRGIRRQETDKGGRRAHGQERYDQGGLRPSLSPKWPNSMPPTGRATKPTAAVLNEARTAATSLAPGKNSGPKTRAAAVR